MLNDTRYSQVLYFLTLKRIYDDLFFSNLSFIVFYINIYEIISKEIL